MGLGALDYMVSIFLHILATTSPALKAKHNVICLLIIAKSNFFKTIFTSFHSMILSTHNELMTYGDL